jgi:hypothetical protein
MRKCHPEHCHPEHRQAGGPPEPTETPSSSLRKGTPWRKLVQITLQPPGSCC